MKIEGPSGPRNTDKTKKKDSVSSGDGSFDKLLSGDSAPAAGASSAQSMARIDSLLSIQAADNPTERASRARMRQRAETLLEELEGVRRALLSGTLTVGHVIDIADIVASHREKVVDPRLTAILDEIDLRAQIEIAKMRVALDRQTQKN